MSETEKSTYTLESKSDGELRDAIRLSKMCGDFRLHRAAVNELASRASSKLDDWATGGQFPSDLMETDAIIALSVDSIIGVAAPSTSAACDTSDIWRIVSVEIISVICTLLSRIAEHVESMSGDQIISLRELRSKAVDLRSMLSGKQL